MREHVVAPALIVHCCIVALFQCCIVALYAALSCKPTAIVLKRLNPSLACNQWMQLLVGRGRLQGSDDFSDDFIFEYLQPHQGIQNFTI